MAPTMLQLDFAEARVRGAAPPLRPTSPDDPAFILYTSGSSGRPKGVYFDQRGLLHDAMRRTNCTHLSAEDRLALVFAPTVSAAQQDVFGALLNGATLFVVDVRRKGLQELVRVLQRGRITLLFCVPFIFRRLVDLCRDPKVFASIRHVCFAADRVFASDIELFRRHFPQSSLVSMGVGSSEANLFCHWFIPRGRPMEEPLAPVGYVLPGYQVTLADAEGNHVPRGEVGEIVITSRYIALGYWNDEVPSRRAFVPDARDPKARVFRTGDLARMGPDGLLELVGRKDRQLKIRGNRVEPAEIEATIRRHPDILDVAVIARTDDSGAELAAYVVADKAASLSSAALSAWLVERLPEAMRPKDIALVDEIPMLGNFKHDIAALTALDRKSAAARRLAAAAARPVRAALPQSPDICDAVRAAWERALGPESFAADEPWEQSGGDSLKALDLVFVLEETLGRSVAMNLLGPATRPSELVAGLQTGSELDAESADVRPLVFLLPGAYGPLLHHMRIAEALGEEADVRILEYARVDPAMLGEIDFATYFDGVVAEAIEQIRAAAGSDAPIRLLGHSFGGFVAFEAARRMAEDGSDIEFLGLIDTSPLMLTHPPSYLMGEALVPELTNQTLTQKLWRTVERGELWRKLTGRGVRLLVERHLQREQFSCLAWEWRLLQKLPLRRSRAILRQAATRFVRAKSIHDYRLQRYQARLCVFRAIDNPDWARWRAPEDLGWCDYCGEVWMWRVPGDHAGVAHAANIEVTKGAIIAALHMCQDAAEAECAMRQAG
jgi:acyl-coenzyme A synthetase/AMP-(fatty) acid ligase/thioesterase domain-containing protein